MTDRQNQPAPELTPEQRALLEALMEKLRTSRLTLGQAAALILGSLPRDVVKNRSVEELASLVEKMWQRVARGQ